MKLKYYLLLTVLCGVVLGIVLQILRSTSRQRARMEDATERAAAFADHVGPVAFSPDGSTIACGPRFSSPIGGVELWSLDGYPLGMLASDFSPEDMKTRPTDIVYSNSRASLAVNYGDRLIVYDVASREERFHLDLSSSHSYLSPRFADEDKILSAVRKDHRRFDDEGTYSVLRWDALTGKQLACIDLAASSTLKAVSPDGRFSAFQDNRSGQGKVLLVDTLDGKVKAQFNEVYQCIFTKTNRFIYLARSRTHGTFEIKKLNATTLGEELSVKIKKGYRHSLPLAVSDEEDLLAIGAFDATNEFSVLELLTGRLVLTAACGPEWSVCTMVAFSPSGRTLATAISTASTRDVPVKPHLKLWEIPK